MQSNCSFFVADFCRFLLILLLIWFFIIINFLFFFFFFFINIYLNPVAHMGRARRKLVFGHLRAAKALIRLRIRAVWSGPSLSANRVIGYCRMWEWRANTRMIRYACAGWSESANFAHVRRQHVSEVFSTWTCLLRCCHMKSLNKTESDFHYCMCSLYPG